MLIKTDRLSIRFMRESDWKIIKSIWEDFNSSEFAQYDRPHNTDDTDVKLRIAKWAEANKGTDHLFFAICHGNDVVGYCSFNRRESGYELGYCFHSMYHGKGYAKECLIALFDYFRALDIRMIYAGTALNNTPSVALLKSLGFQQVLTENVSFYKDNKGNDIIFVGGVYQLAL